MPRVSVIVPVYNVEKYISRCLESILNQTEHDLEIIVVNDGSKDNSQKIIDDYAKKYPDKIISLIKNNGGLSDARNFGIPYATGEYIGFVDSDDYIESTMYEELLEKSENGKKKIVSCGYYMDWEEKRVEKIDSIPESIEEYLCSGLVVAWNKIYKRDWLIKTDILFPKGLLYEDTQFFCQLLNYIESTEEIGIVTKPLVHYIQRENSISYSNSSKIDDIHTICTNVVEYYLNQDYEKKYLNEIEYKFVKTLLGSFMLKYMRISDKKIKRESLKNNWKYINTQFPNWKNNIYIKGKNGLVNKMYFSFMNYITYLIITSFPPKFLEMHILK